jgi:hypothetical protein
MGYVVAHQTLVLTGYPHTDFSVESSDYSITDYSTYYHNVFHVYFDEYVCSGVHLFYVEQLVTVTMYAYGTGSVSASASASDTNLLYNFIGCFC